MNKQIDTATTHGKVNQLRISHKVPRGKVDWERVKSTTDDDITRQIVEDPDAAPELTEQDLDEAWVIYRDGTRERYRDRVPVTRSR